MKSHQFAGSARVSCALFVTALLLATTAMQAYAKPPKWAPAHGYRAKHERSYHDRVYTGYRGHRWPDDYGVLQGRCNRSAVGAVVGASVGGAVGASVSKGDDRLIAVILGSAVGAVIGHQIGGRIDDLDRGCFGHSLELAKTGQTIRWANPETGLKFAVTPLRDFERDGRQCREFETATTTGLVWDSNHGRACRNSNGSWSPL